MFKKSEGRKQKRWCSKHQVVHGEDTWYWSCYFPNDENLKKMVTSNRKRNPKYDE